MSERFLRGRLAIPWDSTEAFFPQARFVVDALRAGQAPWWNPYIFGGQPALGDPQGMIFTPQVLVGLIAGPRFNQYVFDMTSLVAVLCGGIGLARYARAYADSRVLPVLGALVFIAGGVATSRLQHVPQIASYALLPIQLLLLRAVCLRPTVLRTLLLTLALIAGGLNPNQVTYLSAFMFVPFVALHLWESRRRPAAVVALAAAAVVVVIAVAPLLSAILEFVSISNRPTVDIAEAYGKSFPLFNIASIFLPGLYGVITPLNGYWPPTDLTQDFLYVGMIPAAVFLCSLFMLRKLPAITVLCWGSLVAWYVFAMGMNTPVFPFLFHYLPGMSGFRRPADGAYLLNFCMALAIGTCRWPDRMHFPRWPVSVVIATMLVIAAGGLLASIALYAASRGHGPDLLILLRAFAVRLGVLVALVLVLSRSDRRVTRWLVAPLVIGLTVADIADIGRDRSVFGAPIEQVYTGNLDWTTPPDAVAATITFLREHGVGGANPAWRMEALGGDLSGDMPMAFGLMTTQGYDPLELRSFAQAISAARLPGDPKKFTAASPDYNSPDYRRLGLRYVLFHHYIADHIKDFGAFGAAVEQIKAQFTSRGWARQVPAPGLYEVWELQNAGPRATVVADNGGAETPCAVVSFATTAVSVECQAAAPGWLVLGDAYAPGWIACVNGKAAPVVPFDAFFRSVAVPQGPSRTDFHYQAVPFLRRPASCPAT